MWPHIRLARFGTAHNARFAGGCVTTCDSPRTWHDKEPRRQRGNDTEAVCQLLSALVHSKAADDFVFTRANGKPVRDFRVKWENACAHAGVPDLLFHDLRRTG